MRVVIFGLRCSILSAIIALPLVSSAQSPSLSTLLGSEGQQFCLASWNDAGELDRRLYQACLQEQRQARLRIQLLHNRFATQGFYRDVAFPFCRANQNSAGVLNLVEFSFCLDDEITGYQAIQDLRRRYGGNRVDAEAGQALAAAGSWDAAARQLKRSNGLKMIRQGS